MYQIDKLMEQTRQLAVDYHQQTGRSLPVTNELACYDACRLLSLERVDDRAGVDAVFASPEQTCQIKGRVIFDEQKTGQRLGKINTEGDWQQLLVVLFDAHYQPAEIYALARSTLLPLLNQNKRGTLSVAKVKAVAEPLWPQAMMTND